MRRACGAAVVVLALILVSAGTGRGADEPIYDSTIEGTVDMVDYVHRTISIIPLLPIGETFHVAGNCKVTLDRKDTPFWRLEPGHRVSLAYNRNNSTVGRIIAIPGDRLATLRPNEKPQSDDRVATLRPKDNVQPEEPRAVGMRARSYVRMDVSASPSQLTVRAMR